MALNKGVIKSISGPSPDPLGFGSSADPHIAMDLYRYAANNPVHLQDSTGMAPDPTSGPIQFDAVDMNGNAMRGGYVDGAYINNMALHGTG